MIDEYRLAFARIRKMGIDLANRILEVVSEREFFELSQKDIEDAFGSGNVGILRADYRRKILNMARDEMDFIVRNNINTHYFRNDPHYPQNLLQTPDAPILIFGKGDANLNSKYIVSIVGTRNATAYGKQVTREIVECLAQEHPDTLIVSGLAYGIDIAAHRAALEFGLPTVGVLAHGLNTIYPAPHRDTAAKMVHAGGAVITEYLSQDTIHRSNFLARNRIVAGLGHCTIVVESAEHGGSLVTTAIANSYGRDVFAVPGRTNDKYSVGCNNLIARNGAHVLNSGKDVIKYMQWENPDANKPKEATLFPEYTKEEQEIIDLLTEHGEMHGNYIARLLDVPTHEMMGRLVAMEFSGYIHSLPGGNFTL